MDHYISQPSKNIITFKADYFVVLKDSPLNAWIGYTDPICHNNSKIE
ncbi:hypothetical protein J694_0298 [Acinetobacter sp. 1281984]|nr:hypothetical protein J694_0298 [Acinetobacter sp. 1281984]